MNTEELISKLREKGYKVTPQRLAICEIALFSKDHPTADQIYQNVIRKYSTISVATVYQTLHLLKDIGLVQELGFSDSGSRYDSNMAPHINIFCLNCGEVYDYEAKSVEHLWSQIIGELGFKPIGQRLDLYTYCKKCKRK